MTKVRRVGGGVERRGDERSGASTPNNAALRVAQSSRTVADILLGQIWLRRRLASRFPTRARVMVGRVRGENPLTGH